MTELHAYSYTVLRYVHDVMTGEFANVGVIAHCRGLGFLKAKVRTTHGRLSAMFPDLDRSAFRSTMRSIERAIERLAKANADAGMLALDGDAATFARQVVPEDESSLRWSPVGIGFTDDPERELEDLFHRMVTQYDERGEHRRQDDEVWRPVRDLLKERSLLVEFEEKTISGTVDQIAFKHAWKNGVWHCYEPLSFDLANADGIKEKAHRWAGRLVAVQDSAEQFRPYFIVGRPQDSSLDRAFDTAIALLKMSPGEPEIFLEHEVGRLVDLIEDEVRTHQAATS